MKKDKIVNNLRELKNEYFINSKYETKWIKVSKSKIDYYKKLIDYFYNNEYIIVRILDAKNKEKLNNDKYNKGNDELKSEIQEWINKYKDKNYCDDIFLEDMILSIK